jgi:hypothetical protein
MRVSTSSLATRFTTTVLHGDIDRAWTRRSGFVATICLTAVCTVAATDSRQFDQLLPILWPLLLVITWLFLASFLISWAERVNERFFLHAVEFCGFSREDVPVHYAAVGLRSSRLLVVLVPFVTVGLVVSLLVPVPWIWKLTDALVVGSCFYYASFGLWGSYAASEAVSRLAEKALARKRLNVFHSDCLAGLGFAKAYADKASLFVLSGVAAFPMAVALAHQAMSDRQNRGKIIALLVACAIGVWAIFAILASLRGRYAIAGTIELFRAPLFDEIAQEKQRLIDAKADAEQFRLIEIREKALERINTNIFVGLGGWRDFYSLGAGALAVWRISNEVLSKTQHLTP